MNPESTIHSASVVEMEGRGEEDPFGSLIGLCQITSSQEQKLQSCPFALESENFPDAVDSLPSQYSPNPPSSEPPGIIMVSPPETDGEDGDDDKASIYDANPQENEEFQTPPEHHNLSSSSSQEDTQKLATPRTTVDERVGGSDDVGMAAIDAGCGENEANFVLGERGENLGFLETEELEGEVQEIEGIESESKKSRGFEGELDEPVSKKCRVWEENWDSERQTVCIDETEMTEKVDGLDEEELFYLDVDENDEGIGLDEDKIVIDLDSDEESVGIDGVRQNVEMRKNVEGISDDQNDSEGEMEKLHFGHGGGVREQEEGGDLDNGEKYVMINGGLVVEGFEEGHWENGNDELRESGKGISGGKNIEEIEKFKYTSRSGVDNPGKEKSVGLDGGNKSSLVNGDLVVEEFEEGNRNNRSDEVQRSSEQVLACRNIGEIDQFRYHGGDDDRNQCSKEIVQRRRELPFSLRGKDDDVGAKQRVGKLDMKNLPWMELLDSVAVILGKVNDVSEDVDFLEAAKRKGMTFPQPRWI